MDFRRATDGEIAAIKESAIKRKAQDKGIRKDFPCPEAAKLSTEGGVLWALIERWQDSPFYVVTSAAAILWVIGTRLIHFID